MHAEATSTFGMYHRHVIAENSCLCIFSNDLNGLETMPYHYECIEEPTALARHDLP